LSFLSSYNTSPKYFRKSIIIKVFNVTFPRAIHGKITKGLIIVPESVSIIIRNKNRFRFLKRAILDILAQKHQNWEIILINDGGEKSQLEAVMKDFYEDLKEKLRLIHNSQSLGRGGSAHQGLMCAKSKYIVLHDDDDTWEPSFLETCIKRLESARENSVGGVVTFTRKIVESITADEIIIHETAPFFNIADPFIPLELLTYHNPFPPIAFLFKRDTLKKVGSYRQDLEVAEDWDFHMRFVARYDIAVIGEYLANYHLREGLFDGEYSNSVFGLRELHLQTQVLLRNELIRKDIRRGTLCLADLMQHMKQLKFLEETGPKISQLISIIERLKTLKRNSLPVKILFKLIGF
jgi:glycosyltransferase involved in cell wall biosynthesis